MRAQDFFTDIYFMMGNWLQTIGFSIGIDACKIPEKHVRSEIPKKLQRKIEKIIIPALNLKYSQSIEDAIYQIYQNFEKSSFVPKDEEEEMELIKILLPFESKTKQKRNAEIEKNIQKAYMFTESLGVEKLENKMEEERREKLIQIELNQVNAIGTNISSLYLEEFNALNVMGSESGGGAKGSNVNTAQITSMLGQQYIRGERPPQTISGGLRTLPFFTENDINPKSRGFIENSFGSGLNSIEYFFHAMASREGLLDTATKTPDTGHYHRLIGKMGEDIKIDNDFSVRNSTGQIYDQCYLFNPSKLESITTKEGTFPSFINFKRIADKINNKYGREITTVDLLLPYEHYFIYNDMEVDVVDVGAKRITIKYIKKNIIETIIMENVDIKNVKKYNYIKPRTYYNTPITTILPIDSYITIKTEDKEYSVKVDRYSPTHMFIKFPSPELSLKNDELHKRINPTVTFKLGAKIDVYIVAKIVTNRENTLVIDAKTGRRMIQIDEKLKILNPDSDFKSGSKIKLLMSGNIISISKTTIKVTLPAQKAKINISDVDFDTALTDPIKTTFEFI